MLAIATILLCCSACSLWIGGNSLGPAPELQPSANPDARPNLSWELYPLLSVGMLAVKPVGELEPLPGAMTPGVKDWGPKGKALAEETQSLLEKSQLFSAVTRGEGIPGATMHLEFRLTAFEDAQSFWWEAIYQTVLIVLPYRSKVRMGLEVTARAPGMREKKFRLVEHWDLYGWLPLTLLVAPFRPTGETTKMRAYQNMIGHSLAELQKRGLL